MITPSPLWTATDVMAAITCTDRAGDEAWVANGISIDTRTIETGDLFFAISGANFDAHEFVAQAFAKGCVAAVVSRDPGNCPAGAPLLIVEDTTQALQQLAVAARNRLQGKVVAVTGSVGKTGTKEMLRFCLASVDTALASTGNLNNHWGLPLSLCRIPADTAFTVLEIGMNHPNEIRPLVKIARPHVAIVTAVEAAHTEYFSSVEEIADAKAEIFEGLEPGGTAVINRDSPYFERLAAAARASGVERIISFGEAEDADVRLVHADLEAASSVVEAALNDKTIRYRIGAPGRHVVMNSLAVVAAVDTLVSDVGGDTQSAATALGDFTPLKGRGRHISIQLPDGDFLLVDESYNASPASMRAAMAVVGRIEPELEGRRIAVLGDMLELGDSATQEHCALAEPLQDNAFDLVFTAGQLSQNLWSKLPEGIRGGHSLSPDKLAMVITSVVHPGDVVMVKGSLGSRIGVVVDALMTLDQSYVPVQQAVCNGN